MSNYLTRSQYTHKGVMVDTNMGMKADVYTCKNPIHMTMNDPYHHKNKHGLGDNPAVCVSGQRYDTVFVMRVC